MPHKLTGLNNLYANTLEDESKVSTASSPRDIGGEEWYERTAIRS
jgi:hypothetical protein